MTINRTGWGAAFVLSVLAGMLYLAAARPLATPDASVPLRAALVDETRVDASDATRPYKWRTLWQLDWPVVPDAHAYLIEYKTAEGVSRKASIEDAPRFRIEVAKGESAAPHARPTRDIQLQTIQSLLAVRVVPRFADHSIGSPSRWIEVGRVVP